MQCQRSGYCCIKYDVIIVNDPTLGIVDNNLIAKNSDVRCQHLLGEKPGEFSCAIHNEPWYKKTPCFSHCQIEDGDNKCRLGEHVIETGFEY